MYDVASYGPLAVDGDPLRRVRRGIPVTFRCPAAAFRRAACRHRALRSGGPLPGPPLPLERGGDPRPSARPAPRYLLMLAEEIDSATMPWSERTPGTYLAAVLHEAATPFGHRATVAALSAWSEGRHGWAGPHEELSTLGRRGPMRPVGPAGTLLPVPQVPTPSANHGGSQPSVHPARVRPASRCPNPCPPSQSPPRRQHRRSTCRPEILATEAEPAASSHAPSPPRPARADADPLTAPLIRRRAVGRIPAGGAAPDEPAGTARRDRRAAPCSRPVRTPARRGRRPVGARTEPDPCARAAGGRSSGCLAPQRCRPGTRQYAASWSRRTAVRRHERRTDHVGVRHRRGPLSDQASADPRGSGRHRRAAQPGSGRVARRPAAP